MDEPSVLDYLKEKLNPRNWGKSSTISLPDLQEEPRETPPEPQPEKSLANFPWNILAALAFALIAQRLLEPSANHPVFAVILYALAACFVILAILQNDLQITEIRAAESASMDLGVRKIPLFISLPLILLSFLVLDNNTFTFFNVVIWFSAIFFAVRAFWIPQGRIDFKALGQKIWTYVQKPFINLHLTSWSLLVIAVFLVAAFFHLSKLDTAPLNMTSDHAEKLVDVQSVLKGQYSIFMANNGGREPMQFYLVAAMIKWFGAGINFLTLKLSMALMFLAGLIYVYLLGKEVGNRWTGLLAMLFMGFASWTNILARAGMRQVLVTVFVAPVLYYLLRGFRRSNRNDFVLAGLFLGVGLLGYTAFRITPVVIALAILVYCLHEKDKTKRKEALLALGIIALLSLIIFLPLIRFAIEYPDAFNYRSLSRMTSIEVPTAPNLLKVFLSNSWNALTMPFWKDGSTWVNSVTDRPALDVVTAALYALGLVIMAARWIKRRRWQDLFLLLSIPIFMLPSIMALAFPIENPVLSRTGGAIVPIILVAVLAFQSLITSLWQKSRHGFGKVWVAALAILLVILSANQNYNLAFRKYVTAYENATWNTQQIGEVCKEYIDSVGSPDTCYVSGLGYWVDTRLVAMTAGYPDKDFALWPKDYSTVVADPRAKMFIVRPDQTQDLATLHQMFPNGFETYHNGSIPDHDFITFLIPPVTQ